MDASAAGYHIGMPNTDQAQGFEYGGINEFIA